MDCYVVVGRAERCRVSSVGDVTERWHVVELLHSVSQARSEQTVPKEKFLEHKLGAMVSIELVSVSK
jgi:hypothetical protein